MNLRACAVLTATIVVAACGGESGSMAPGGASMRRLVGWLDGGALDAGLALELERGGVDMFVVPRGTIDLAADLPVLQLATGPEVDSSIPVGAVLTLRAGSEVDAEQAVGLWRALSGPLGRPAQLLIDLPAVPAGTADLVEALGREAGVPVVPVLVPDQLDDDEAVRAAINAGEAVVLIAGSVPVWRPGAVAVSGTLGERLAPLAGTGVRVRAGIVLAPRVDPKVGRWPSPLDPLTEGGLCEVLLSSQLERSFRFRRASDWSGRSWEDGDTVAVEWLDASELDAAFAESSRLQVPELVGWDLVSLPPPAPALGLSHEALVAYLRGDGPQPTLRVDVTRSGRRLTVVADNPTVFPSALSSYQNWIEVTVEGGGPVAEDLGGFDGSSHGRARGGEWESVTSGAYDSIRLYERFVAPGEAIEPATIRLPPNAGAARVRWQLLLGTGRTVSSSGE